VKAPFVGGRALHAAATIGRRYDRIVVHFQPALYYRPRAPISKVMTSLRLLELVLRRRRKVELLVHEADPPKMWRPDYFLLRLAFRLAATVSFHTAAEREALERGYRVKVRGNLVPHVVATVAHPSKDEARRRLGLEQGSPMYLCAGFLQPSKGFDRAVEAFSRAGANGSALYVLGSVRDATPENMRYARSLAERCRTVPGVTMVDRFVPDDEFDLWVVAADWVVLPYRRAWSSGILARAHALGTPAIVAGVGGLVEQADEHDVVVQEDGELDRVFAGRLPPAAGGSVETGASGRRHHRHGAGSRPETDWDPELEAVIATKKGRAVLIAFILVSVGLAAVAQLTLKHGMNQVTHHGEIPLDLGHPVDVLRRILGNASVWAGLATFVLSAAVWLVVLSRASLSFAYPFASLTYVLILVFDRFILDEPISGLRYGGVALIIAGLLLISRTHQTA
jgi:multidrug transporter EmrE-like cation transporter